MELQKQILFFFSNHHSPFLDKLVEIITMFGEETIVLAIVVAMFWCFDKKKGFATSFCLLYSLIGMATLKAIVRFPRPWTLVPELKTVRMETATGYSFPSGHTTTAASFYTALAQAFKKKWVSIICAALILLVGLSRMYLCVHWPLDVLCGFILGCGLSFLLFETMARLFDNKEKSLKVSVILGIISTTGAVVITVLLSFDVIDPTAFTDFSKTLALAAGACWAYRMERSSTDFVPQGSLVKRVLRFVVGMVGVLLFQTGLKLALPYIPACHFIRYFLVGFWAFGLYPMLGTKVGLF